jgi:predicted NBD/HSP70 family sugar kinase
LRGAATSLNVQQADYIAASVAGATENGVITNAGQLEEYGYVGRPIAEDIAAEFGVGPERVILLNDCEAGAESERHEWLARDDSDADFGMYATLSTGFGGALWTPDGIIPDEPGHHFMRPGAICGDGKVGHIEAWISGSGIERNYGVPAKTLDHEDARWNAIKADFAAAVGMTLDRYQKLYGRVPDVVGFTGAVLLGGPDMLGGLNNDLAAFLAEKDNKPVIDEAIHGEASVLYGAAFVARDRAMTA